MHQQKLLEVAGVSAENHCDGVKLEASRFHESAIDCIVSVWQKDRVSA